MREETPWLKADYYDRFCCKGGRCRTSCCEGWEIAVNRADYFKLIGMDCSEEMHHRLECAFRVPREPSPERFRLISPNWLGVCPLHAEDGMCMLQRECGAQALPELCRVYPRSLKRVAGQNRACCSNSCEAVIEALMRPEKLRFTEGALCAAPEYEEAPDPSRLELRQAAMDALEDEAAPLNVRMGNICRLLGESEFVPDPGRAEAGMRALMETLEDLCEGSESLKRACAPAFARYASPNSRAIDAYWEDAEALEARFPQWARWFENILLNHFFYADMPFVDARLQPKDVCAGLCVLYGAMRALCAARCAQTVARADLADGLAGLFHLIEHGAFYYNARILARAPEAMLAL